MNQFKKNIPFYIISFMVFVGASYILYPYFQYYVDPDATSYFTIVNRYLTGDIDNAINAFWSPLGIWLTVLTVKVSGMALIPAAVWVNGLACVATLWTSQRLFHRFRTDTFEKICFAVCFALFWSFANFKQNFTDIWQYFFLLVIIQIVMQKDFLNRSIYWILIGLIGALAYFAKAYAFYFIPFFLLLFIAYHIFILKDLSIKKGLKIGVVVMFTLVIVATPWIYLLHQKYGMWTTSTAGTLNLSWFLIGEPVYHESINAILPPSVPGGIFLFEDPWFNQAAFPKWYHSISLFFKQIVRSTYNYLGWTESSNMLSSFYFVCWIVGIAYFTNKKRLQSSGQIVVIWILFTAYPLAFWLMTFDNGRYLWLTLPLMSILVLYFMDLSIFKMIQPWMRKGLVAVLFLSFLIQPLRDIKNLAHQGKEEFEIATALKLLHIQGGFISNYGYNTELDHFILRVAYFSGNPWFCQVKNKWSDTELIADAQRYKVPYYFYFYNHTGSAFELKNDAGIAYPEVTEGKIPGLKVFQLR